MIGGGKAFRESHVNNDPISRQKNELKSFASRIKANSLTDIESINSQERLANTLGKVPELKNSQDELDIPGMPTKQNS